MASGQKKLFAGHTRAEAYMFYCTCLWFLQPLALLSFADALHWHRRPLKPLQPRAPFIAVPSVIA
eukprot:6520124-Prymnesium_polylepis.1